MLSVIILDGRVERNFRDGSTRLRTEAAHCIEHRRHDVSRRIFLHQHQGLRQVGIFRKRIAAHGKELQIRQACKVIETGEVDRGVRIDFHLVRNQGHGLAVGLSSAVNRQTVLEVKRQLIFRGQQAARNRCVVPQICQAINERKLRHKRVARFCRAQVIGLDQLVIQQETHLGRFSAHRTRVAIA